MTRYKLDGSPISVAYGHDQFTEVFLSVYDERLKFNESDSDEVNSLLDKCYEGGNGAYLDLHTGMVGFGHKVSKATMEVFFRRFRVPEEHIRLLLHKKK
jgi:hypothetical protein